MKWAVEIQKSSLENRNLADLLSGLGFELIEGTENMAAHAPYFDNFGTASEVWNEAKKLRDAFKGPAAIDPDFTLGAVVNYSSHKPKRHHFLEVESCVMKVTVSPVNLAVLPPQNLSQDELKEWEREHAECEYQMKLEQQKSKLEPAFWEPKATKILEALEKESHTGETLYKMYEIMEGHPSNRRNFQSQFEIDIQEFKRFGDAVHNPVVSGDLARHAYSDRPKTPNPMTFQEAKSFIYSLAKEWLASIRRENYEQ